MKIFLAGATGALGARAVPVLVGAGHDVTGIARTTQKAAQLEATGATPISTDIFDVAALTDAVRTHDVVINLATSIPSPTRSALRRAWRTNDRVRRDGSRNLVDAAIATGVQRYIQESIAFMYADHASAWIDESSALDPPDIVRSALDAESQARRFAETGATGVVLRFGMFFANGTVHTDTQLRAARLGISTFIGEQDAYMPTLHLDDGARAVAAALDVPSGTYNVTDDEPLRRAELGRVLADVVGRRRLFALPPWMVRLAGDNFEMLARSERVSNASFKAAAGWNPRTARQTVSTLGSD